MAVRPGGATDPASRIERLVRQQERRFRRVFLQAIEVIQNSGTLDEIADLLSAGRLEDALRAVDDAAALIGSAYGAALSEAAQDTALFLSRALTVAVGFDQTNQRAVNAIQRNQLRLISGFSAEQRATVRQALARGIAEGMNPRDQARLFREVVGLTPRQEAAVANFRRLLIEGDREALTRQLRDRRFDSTVRRSIRTGEPLSPETIDRMVGRYRDRYIAYRAEVIGRTEALRSAHEGSEEMYNQAIESGQLDPRSVRRKWNTAGDERVRGSHSALDGETRAPGETWQAEGGSLRFPGDPQAPPSETIGCRCVISTRLTPVDELS